MKKLKYYLVKIKRKKKNETGKMGTASGFNRTEKLTNNLIKLFLYQKGTVYIIRQ